MLVNGWSARKERLSSRLDKNRIFVDTLGVVKDENRKEIRA